MRVSQNASTPRTMHPLALDETVCDDVYAQVLALRHKAKRRCSLPMPLGADELVADDCLIRSRRAADSFDKRFSLKRDSTFPCNQRTNPSQPQVFAGLLRTGARVEVLRLRSYLSSSVAHDSSAGLIIFVPLTELQIPSVGKAEVLSAGGNDWIVP